jgi:deoxyribodipyrimidine photo-lyase
MTTHNPVDPRRVRMIQSGAEAPHSPVLYWMNRDQRADDNWALLYARQTAKRLEAPLIVAVCFTDDFHGCTRRHAAFMLRGLDITRRKLAANNIPLVLLHGHPPRMIAQLAASLKIGFIVCDFDPLRVTRQWKSALCRSVSIPVLEVDAHNVVPSWEASTKLEYGAYTLRPKINRLLPDFLREFPPLRANPRPPPPCPPSPSPLALLADLHLSHAVSEVQGAPAGPSVATRCLNQFIESTLANYATDANNPNSGCRSNLSPYLNFGQLSAQRVALEVQQYGKSGESRNAFLEQLIIRKELADNFCLWNEQYDSFEGLQPWARNSLLLHAADPRDYLYSTAEFEQARTHDPLWNAAQMEMATSGRMHGYLRMYWAKKILEWSPDPATAFSTAIYLNDRYALDGHNPNGYAGVAWAIGGTHDRAWGERPVFGKIRYMNNAGCQRKFDTQPYIRKWI